MLLMDFEEEKALNEARNMKKTGMIPSEMKQSYSQLTARISRGAQETCS